MSDRVLVAQNKRVGQQGTNKPLLFARDLSPGAVKHLEHLANQGTHLREMLSYIRTVSPPQGVTTLKQYKKKQKTVNVAAAHGLLPRSEISPWI